jgi:hypothetical protein
MNKPIVQPTETLVTICIERLKALELLEAQLPILISNAIKEDKKNKLKALHEKDKINPEAVNLRVKRYNERNKEMISEKRKEKRKIKKSLVPLKPIENNTKIVEPASLTVRFDL